MKKITSPSDQSAVAGRTYKFRVREPGELVSHTFIVKSETDMSYIARDITGWFTTDLDKVFELLVRYARPKDLWGLRVSGWGDLATRVRRAQCSSGEVD